VRADEPPPAAPTAAPAALDPVGERAQALKEAASLLEKAGAARARGNRSFAEQLFSSAEILVGAEALAELAPLFRQGAPPRITSPLKPSARDAAPQPATAGGSDEEEPEAKPLRGTLGGTVTAGGKPLDGFSVVTLEPASGRWHRRAPRQRVMEQRGRQFAPRVLVVPVGSTVSFPNFDSVYHNVFSTSEAKPFDLGIFKAGNAREVTFDREGVITLGCNLHANMSAHIVVVGAPHYVVTDDKGRFAFKNLEPGSYRLRAWSERSREPATREVTVKPDRNSVSIEVKADGPRGPLPDKFGVARGG
jgi:plastocyanin